MLFTDLVSTSWYASKSGSTYRSPIAYLIDAADSETEGATFDTSAVHVVPDEKDQLKWSPQLGKF